MSTALRRVTQIRTHLATTAVPTSSTTTTTARQATLASRPFTSSPIIGSSQSTVNMSDVKLEVDQAIKDNFVMVFSKSYCPYCSATKKLLSEAAKAFPENKKYKVIELDQRDDGSDIQAYLKSKNGQGTVPHVYINQEFIGGNSDLQAIKGAKLDAALKAEPKA